MQPELIDFIKKKQQEGVPNDQITQILLSRGWPLEVINQGMAAVLSPAPVTTAPVTYTGSSLMGPLAMAQTAFSILMKHIGAILFLSVIPGIATFLLSMVISVIVVGGFFSFSRPGTGFNPQVIMLAVGGFILLMLAIVVINAWFQAAMYMLIASHNTPLSFGTVLKKSFTKLLSFGWVLFLSGFIITGGYLLLVIPGILFMVWFTSAPFIMLTENRRGMDALLASREYIRGFGTSVLLRILFTLVLGIAFIILTFLIGELFDNTFIRSLIVFILNLLITPFYIAYFYVIYENLRSIKGTVTTNTSNGSKFLYIMVALLGFVLIIFSVGFLISTTTRLFMNSRNNTYRLNRERSPFINESSSSYAP